MSKPLPVSPCFLPSARGSLRLIAAALLLSASACGGDSTGPAGSGGLGSGDVQVSGSVTLSFSGPAVSGTDGVTGNSTFAVTVSDDASAANTFDVVFIAGRPSTGTYSIGNPDSEVYGELLVGSDFYESIVGEVTISSSSADAIVGTSTFNGIRLGGTEQVSVSATFDAACFPVPGGVSCE